MNNPYFCGSMAERQVVAVGIDAYLLVATDGASEDGLREVVQEQALDGSLDGACAELWVIAFSREQIDG